MKLSGKFVKTQLSLLKTLRNESSIEAARRGQNILGKLMCHLAKRNTKTENYEISSLPCAFITPKDELSSGIILYLHGGGYVCGGIEYARGFASILASKCGIKVFTVAYSLAPEAPFPTQIDEALIAYDHLLSLGYRPNEIILCGESAGGGLCYSLCLKLKELQREMPAGIIAISPWTDLTSSGESYTKNRRKDPSISIGKLERFGNCYVYGSVKERSKPDCIIKDPFAGMDLKRLPLASPLFADLSGMPSSLIFAGGSEIMLDDSVKLHEKLKEQGSDSRIHIAKNKWHAYVLYCLDEDKEDFERISKFIRSKIPARKLRWMSLDNAAKIYPAARRRNWTNVFRLSATLTENIDTGVLKNALDITVRRFPSIAVRLRTGMFWYYIEEVPRAPEILNEKPYPLSRMVFDDIRKCALRVLVYNNRIAVEFFHALTDGNGGLVFLKTLLSEYIREKYNIHIPPSDGILNVLDEPSPAELEDSFLKHAGQVKASRSDTTAFKLTGTREKDGYTTNTTFIFDAEDIVRRAKECKVTVTSYFSAALILATMRIQERKIKKIKMKRPVIILVPVNLRKLFDSKSLRNFVLYVTPGIDPRLGEYSFEEIARLFNNQLLLMNTPKQMAAKIAKNVGDEKALIIKLMPLFIKNLAMKLVFNAVGERKSCLALSNLGVCSLPSEMEKYVTRLGFVLGVQASAPYNSGLITYKDKMYLNFIRNIKEPLLEKEFYEVLKELGIRPCVESNTR